MHEIQSHTSVHYMSILVLFEIIINLTMSHEDVAPAHQCVAATKDQGNSMMSWVA